MPRSAAAELLDMITARLRRGCPTIPAGLNYRLVALSHARGLAQIWFRTRGCRYRIHGGGCTVCDYGVSDESTPQGLVQSVDAAISKLPFEPRTLVLSASGSFLDPWEVPTDARTEILRLVVQRLPATDFVLETHASTVTSESLGDCLALLGSQRLGIELGLECADPAVLRFCLNKRLTLSSFRRALSLVASFTGVRVTANILVGIPFLSMTESTQCALDAVRWAFLHGVDRCVLFPVNIRPYTLAHWLYSRTPWSPPTLWDLVDVLARLPVSVLDRVDVAWYAPSRQAAPPLSAEVILAPRTCPRCYDGVVTLLTRYADGLSRPAVCVELADFDCDCKAQQAPAGRDPRPLGCRLLKAYEQATLELLGPEVWQNEKDLVARELGVLKTSKNALCWAI
ncbi:MAG: hypothetical protein HYX75_13290 [Acidobacteria bacterium]|nr:hypothetical protein [Acidobacteriota bacterium]